MSNFIEWLKVKQNSLIQLVAAVIALGQLFGIWELSGDQLAGIMGFIAALFLVLTGQTVTSNFRLADKGWSPGGLDPHAIAMSPKTDLVEFQAKDSGNEILGHTSDGKWLTTRGDAA